MTVDRRRRCSARRRWPSCSRCGAAAWAGTARARARHPVRRRRSPPVQGRSTRSCRPCSTARATARLRVEPGAAGRQEDLGPLLPRGRRDLQRPRPRHGRGRGGPRLGGNALRHAQRAGAHRRELPAGDRRRAPTACVSWGSDCEQIGRQPLEELREAAAEDVGGGVPGLRVAAVRRRGLLRQGTYPEWFRASGRRQATALIAATDGQAKVILIDGPIEALSLGIPRDGFKEKLRDSCSGMRDRRDGASSPSPTSAPASSRRRSRRSSSIPRPTPSTSRATVRSRPGSFTALQASGRASDVLVVAGRVRPRRSPRCAPAPSAPSAWGSRRSGRATRRSTTSSGSSPGRSPCRRASGSQV